MSFWKNGGPSNNCALFLAHTKPFCSPHRLNFLNTPPTPGRVQPPTAKKARCWPEERGYRQLLAGSDPLHSLQPLSKYPHKGRWGRGVLLTMCSAILGEPFHLAIRGDTPQQAAVSEQEISGQRVKTTPAGLTPSEDSHGGPEGGGGGLAAG